MRKRIAETIILFFLILLWALFNGFADDETEETEEDLEPLKRVYK